MLRLLADEDFRWAIVQGLLRNHPYLDIVTVQELRLTAAPDPTILARAAQEGRVVVTHDLGTMVAFAYARVRRGDAMPGVFAVPQTLPTGRAIDDLLILILCSRDDEWDGQVRYLPL